MNSDLNRSEACSSLDGVLGFCETSWMSVWRVLGVHHCSEFSPFVDKSSQCGSLKSSTKVITLYPSILHTVNVCQQEMLVKGVVSSSQSVQLTLLKR